MQKSILLLNPRLPGFELQELHRLYEKFKKPGQVWLASSGSSRTVGQSLKLIALSLDGILQACESVNNFLGLQSKDNKTHWLQTLPVFHIGGLSVSHRAHLLQCQLTVDSESHWNPQNFVQRLEELKISHTSLVPTQVFDIVKCGIRSPAALRAVLVGGASLDSALALQAKSLGWPLLPGFGMTETSAVMASASLKTERFQILPHIEAKVNDEGLLEVRGPSVLRGWAQVQNGKDFFQEVPERTWWTTSDRVEIETINSESYLKIRGRSSDFIKVMGEGVNLSQLRERLTRLSEEEQPGSSLLLYLSSQSDPRTGNRIVLVHERLENFVQRLQQKFNLSVAPYERITLIYEVPKIPRTALGKIDSVELSRLLGFS